MIKQIETTQLHINDVLWCRPSPTMVDILPRHSRPFIGFAPKFSPKGTTGLATTLEYFVPSDCSAFFKTARVDIVWQKVPEPVEWGRMLDVMQQEPDGVVFDYSKGDPTTYPNGVFGVRVMLVVGVTYRVFARRLTTSMMPLDYVFDGQNPDGYEDDDDETHERRRVKGSVPVPCRQSFHVEVTLSDALRALIAEKADLVRVHLDGEKTRDVA